MTNTPVKQAIQAARKKLMSSAARIDDDPQTNSVFSLARTVFRGLDAGDTDLGQVEALVDTVHAGLAETRADKFREQHFDGDASTIWAQVTARLEALAASGKDTFSAALERANGGVVFTAHPTFALPQAARAALAKHVEDNTDASRSDLSAQLAADAREWSASISLQGEHDETQAALLHAQGAADVYAGHVFAVAKAHFPDDWHALRPALPTLASWVGYDLDGRTDIQWWHSVALRLSEKSIQLARYADAVSAIAPTTTSLTALATRLTKASEASAREAALFRRDLTDMDMLIEAATALTAPDTSRITDAAEICDALTEALNGADERAAMAICILRAQVEMLQLGTARIHLRVNAAQVRAVISRDLGVETEDRDLGRVALEELSARAHEPELRTANFADLALERSTARRQIMMCALLLEHIDAGSDIRFLIAEAENPATVMGALYLARQYNVAHKLDISPLFETPEALETGGRFIGRLLEEPAFLAYVRGRGYLSIQLGFSDAGRFIGQVAADMAIERIHNLIISAIAAVDNSIGLLIFNTHGESMGRGAWPGSFEQRFDHALTPWTRGRAHTHGVHLIHEVSFQGGDGFLHFATPHLAETTYGAYCNHLLSEPADCSDDPFYTDTSFVWDTYRSLRMWHERMFKDEDYGHLLSDFATNFLVRAGSRQRRRSGGPGGPSSLRAISHNATLQQLGVPINTAAGIGSAIRRETDRLVDIIDRSTRLRSLINLAVQARIATSIPALRAYAKVYDPGYWVAVARRASPDDAVVYRRVYYALRDRGTATSMQRTADRFSIDLSKFDRLLAKLSDAPSIAMRHEVRLDIHVLHAQRQALMMYAMVLVGRVPTLSARQDGSLQELMDLTLQAQIGAAAEVLEEAFPASSPDIGKLRALAGGGGQDPQGYDDLHAQIIQPLKTIDGLMHKITLAIAQFYRAYG